MIKKLLLLIIFSVSINVFSQSSCGVGFTPDNPDLGGYTRLIDTIKANYDFTQIFVNFKWAALQGTHLDTAYKNDAFVTQWVVPQLNVNNIDLLLCIDITDPLNRKKLSIDTSYHGSDTTFQQPALKQAYITEIMYLTKKYHPEYVAIAVEIDDYIKHNTALERTALLSAISIARDSIKKFDPSIKTFVYFQFENVNINGLWTDIKPFADSSDYFGFSSYPSVLGIFGSNLPLTYYDTIAKQWGNGKPIVFAEFAEPTYTSTVFPGASETNQRNFVNKFFSSVSDLNVALINWVFFHDVTYAFAAAGWPAHLTQYFGSMGLRNDTTGTRKLAFPYFNCNLLSVNSANISKNIFRAFPNPAGGGEVQFEFKSLNEPSYLKIYNLLGACIKTIQIQEGTSSIKVNIDGFSKGLYLAQLSTPDTDEGTLRFIIE